MMHTDLMRFEDIVLAAKYFAPGDVTLARAPGRLDVMGGIADYSGSLVAEMPIASVC
jgi:L-arabinokinase